MNAEDEAFKEEFKPLHVPHAYDIALDWQDKVVFALADINNGTVDEVAERLHELDGDIDTTEATEHARQILIGLYDKGLIKGVEEHGHLRYNLSKILSPNSGKTRV